MSPEPQGALMFLPLIIYSLFMAGFSVYLIPKKGKNLLLVIPAMVPILGLFVLMYLFAQTNKDVADDINMIKKQLNID